MTANVEVHFISEVLENIRKSGYEATAHPTNIPNHKLWNDGLAALIRGPKYRPDILVEHAGRFVLVETKTGPVLLGSVIRARNYAVHFGANVVLCVPDESYPAIPRSVKEFAEGNIVQLCSKSEIGDTLKRILD